MDIIWWELTIWRSIKFLSGCWCVIAHKHIWECYEDGKNLEDHVFHEEDLHNPILEGEASCLELLMWREKEYIFEGDKIHATLQWIHEGIRGLNYSLSFQGRR